MGSSLYKMGRAISSATFTKSSKEFNQIVFWSDIAGTQLKPATIRSPCFLIIFRSIAFLRILAFRSGFEQHQHK